MNNNNHPSKALLDILNYLMIGDFCRQRQLKTPIFHAVDICIKENIQNSFFI